MLFSLCFFLSGNLGVNGIISENLTNHVFVIPEHGFAVVVVAPAVAVGLAVAVEDCDALIHASWCGVQLLATAHARNKRDLSMRSVYRPLLENGLFDTLVILQQDKSWISERMNVQC